MRRAVESPPVVPLPDSGRLDDAEPRPKAGPVFCHGDDATRSEAPGQCREYVILVTKCLTLWGWIMRKASVTVRLPAEQVKALDELAKKQRVGRSAVLRRLLDRALGELTAEDVVVPVIDVDAEMAEWNRIALGEVTSGPTWPD
jgi:hypothetical protein